MIDTLSLPCAGLRTERFDLIQPRNVNRLGGRRTESVSFGTPFWTASYAAEPLKMTDFGEIDAFMMQAQVGSVFKAYDTNRPRPVAYAGAPLSGSRAGGGAFDGTANLFAIISPTEIAITSLPALFIFHPGDYLGLVMSDLTVSLHRIMAGVVGNSVGAATVPVLPAVDTDSFDTGATVHLEKPYCLMQIDDLSASRARGSRAISFSASEVFYSDTLASSS